MTPSDVVIVEDELAGGECSYRACMPRLRHAVPAFPPMSEVWLRLPEEPGQ